MIGSRFKEIKKKQFWPFCNFLVLKKIFSDKKVYLIPASSVVDLDPDPSLFCTDSDPCINKQKSKKNLDLYYFVTFLTIYLQKIENCCNCTFNSSKRQKL